MVGATVRVYFKNIINTVKDTYNFDVTIQATTVKQNALYFEFIPTIATVAPLTIDVYDVNGILIASKVVRVVSKAISTGTGLNRKCLFIGDSTTNAGLYTQRLLDIFSTDPMKITLLGTRGTAPNLHEGRGGWTSYDYVYTDSYNTYTNPFRSGGVFNFSNYMSTQGYSSVDNVIINLGINDVFGYFTDEAVLSQIDNIISYYNIMIQSIRAYSSTTKIGIAITIPPNESQDVFGTAYGLSQTQWRYKRNNWLLNKRLISSFGNAEWAKLYLVPINANIDVINNMTDAVHPNTNGYNQIGDSMYYYLKSLE